MATITTELTKKIADLIKIEIPDAELEKYAGQLSTALDVVKDLKELDTSKTEPTSQTHGLLNVLRDDVVKPGIDISQYKNRRNLKNNYFVVDKVL